MNKLQEYTEITLEEGVKIQIKNAFYKSYQTFEPNYIVKKSTNENLGQHVVLYEQIYNFSTGELLKTPIKEDDSDYMYVLPGNFKIDCKTGNPIDN